MIVPVIMAGGSGTRLWPLSRTLNPKQFLPLTGTHTLLQNTLHRLSGLSIAKPITICNEEHRFIVAEQLRDIHALGPIILEPVGRNTAPAIALAALADQQQGKDSLLLVLAADHVIDNKKAFHHSIEQAIPLAEQGQLVTFGIVPNAPQTGYGYIHSGAALGDGFIVDRFVEKPDLSTAADYVASGDYYWNSGMFLFRSSAYLKALGEHRPDILAACEKSMATVTADLDFVRLDTAAFTACPDESIDYAVMEHTDKAVVVPLDAGWNDIGSWSAVWDVMDKDADGNAIKGDVLLENSQHNLVMGDNRLVSLLGVKDLIIVDTKDALLVANKDQVQDVKKLVSQLKTSGRSEWRNHREVYRPWGHYDSIDAGDRYQVKRIFVKPGAKLSVQMHHHRAEHWIVVSGTAKVTKEEHTLLVTENESIYIPLGTVHALENPGKVPLELIEVQSGTYLGEDDIVRLEDRYGRAPE